MRHPAPTDPVAPARWTTKRYLRLVDEGVLGPDDKVELLEGVIVAMAPSNAPHASGVTRLTHALVRAVGDRAVVRVQLGFVAGIYSMPEPDAAVLPGTLSDYDDEHPRNALLVAEVSDTALKQDRLTKGAIYAACGVPEYWILNLRDDCVEVRRRPEPEDRRYSSLAIAHRGQHIEPLELPGVSIAVSDLLPAPARGAEPPTRARAGRRTRSARPRSS
jgi:Uma2 family endonuclease